MSKTCPQCRTENRDQARFCMSCNTPLRADTPARYCPSGRHPMDPGWETCPYCANEGKPGISLGEPGLAPPPPPPPLSPVRRATKVESGPHRGPTIPEAPVAPSASAAAPNPSSNRKKTVFSSEPSDSPSVGPGLRRIVAVMVTYSWRAEGEVFPVREGRNYVGSAPDCEIRVTSDPQLSSRHSTIVFRGKDFWVDDEKSMNGTSVNGEDVEEKRRLPNYSIIKTGATVWSFITILPSPEV